MKTNEILMKSLVSYEIFSCLLDNKVSENRENPVSEMNQINQNSKNPVSEMNQMNQIKGNLQSKKKLSSNERA